jgi:hypothetical protein
LKEEIKKLDTPPTPTPPPPEVILPEEKSSTNVGDSNSLLKETNDLNNKETHVKREPTISNNLPESSSNKSNLVENDIQINVVNVTNLNTNTTDDSKNNATLETVKSPEAETVTMKTTLGMLLLIL